MQFSSKLVLLLTAAAAGVFASPAVDARDVAASQTVQDGDFLYVGVDESVVERRSDGIEKRCTGAWKTPHADCKPGQCECLGDYGCWSCGGGRMQCQPGPGSGQCWT
ncbi:hypothetical protein C8A01DRAFT_37670 [Parachaetomium inaequale]|uniref:Uncharacterized protein n=1 Tax=Parachaetomium inaequale TaxID=2588326 RepID=A0AAN6PCD0_9PEZI|nr:hypothetical protein C8A01DRAFT_37670 [Parachaetomium inaequale]